MLYDKFYYNTCSRKLPEMRQTCMCENNLFEIYVNFSIKMELRILFIFRTLSKYTRDLSHCRMRI